MTQKTLKQSFFQKSALVVAPKLLGKFLVRRWKNKTIAFPIMEVEAYEGFEDKASHAFRGITERNKVMFGPAGYWYVYFTYGMHWMLNIVTGKSGYPSAVLIRSVIASPPTVVGGRGNLNGPAKLTKALRIDKKFNDMPANRKTSLWIEDGGLKIEKSKIKKAPRVGVGYAGPVWSKKPYRFYLADTEIRIKCE